MRGETKQASMDFSEPPPRDAIAERLVSAGYAQNAAILDLNGCLRSSDRNGMPHPWHLPSRLFEFPITVSHATKDGSRTLALRHPLLAGHPFVADVEERLGIAVGCHGDEGRLGSWWHAVDLVIEGRWRDLLDTMRFTTPDDVANSVSYGLDYGGATGRKTGRLTTGDARAMLAAARHARPPAERDCLASLMRPHGIGGGGSTARCPINAQGGGDPGTLAWARVIGIERGWFARRQSGILEWTEAGRLRYANADAATVEDGTGQVAMAL